MFSFTVASGVITTLCVVEDVDCSDGKGALALLFTDTSGVVTTLSLVEEDVDSCDEKRALELCILFCNGQYTSLFFFSLSNLY